MNTSEPSAAELDERADKLAQLLAAAQRREAPPASIEAQVRAAVHAEWLHLHQSRKIRRQRRWSAAAAALLIAISAGWFMRNANHNTLVAANVQPILAVIAQLRGTALLNGTVVAADTKIHGADVLRTRAESGVRIELSNGVSLRVAANTELYWLSETSLQLTQGALYVDSHANAAPLTIHTAQGDVTHLGTRYLVAVEPQSLQVAVREGRVAIHASHDHDQLIVGPLQQVQVSASGAIVRGDLQPTDAMWQWADAMAQPFMLENHSVAEFLQWVASETGCELSYADLSVKAAANSTVLHGQASTRAPLQTMREVLATTDFHAAIEGRQLLITQ